MDESLFTVYFDDPYWVGVIELTVAGNYSVARIVFGPEPTDAQILEYLFKNYPNNVRFTKGLETHNQQPGHINPKRRQREAASLLGKRGTSTKAQEEIQRSYEIYKQEKQQEKHLLKNATNELKYLQKAEKKKQKKRGR